MEIQAYYLYTLTIPNKVNDDKLFKVMDNF